MTEHNNNPISLTDTILETLFSSLENQDGFPDTLIEELRNLAITGELIKPTKVANVLKNTQGLQDEID